MVAPTGGWVGVGVRLGAEVGVEVGVGLVEGLAGPEDPEEAGDFGCCRASAANARPPAVTTTTAPPMILARTVRREWRRACFSPPDTVRWVMVRWGGAGGCAGG